MASRRPFVCRRLINGVLADRSAAILTLAKWLLKSAASWLNRRPPPFCSPRCFSLLTAPSSPPAFTMSAQFDTTLRWAHCVVDANRAPLNPRITNRPIDLSLTYDKKFNAPSKYVWVFRFDPTITESMPDGADEVAPMSLTHSSAIPFISIHNIAPPSSQTSLGPAPYVRWDLPSAASRLSTLWKILSLFPEHTRSFDSAPDVYAQRVRPVFVEAHNGLPLGRWFHDLCGRRNRVTALFIQAFGDR